MLIQVGATSWSSTSPPESKMGAAQRKGEKIVLRPDKHLREAFMNRCRSCNGILTHSERICFSCGEKVAKPSESAGNGMSILLPLAIVISIGLLVYFFPSLRLHWSR